MKLEFYRLWVAIGLIMILMVWAGSLVPLPPRPPIGPPDKLLHFLAYGALAYWWCMLRPQPGHRWMLSGIFVAMGVALEFAQQATGYRTFDVLDMVANTIGVLLGRLAVETRVAGLLVTLDSRMARLRVPPPK